MATEFCCTRDHVCIISMSTCLKAASFYQFKLIDLLNRMGEISIELYWKHAPNTCRNFAELARRGYYNNTIFHRIIQDFMIQGGDPSMISSTCFICTGDALIILIESLCFLCIPTAATGRGGASIYGQTFADEIHPDLRHTGAGILSMANSGPDTNGSQFFITLAPTQWLDGKHAIFGRIHSGMQIIKRIGLVETDKNDRPNETIKILRGRVEKS